MSVLNCTRKTAGTGEGVVVVAFGGGHAAAGKGAAMIADLDEVPQQGRRPVFRAFVRAAGAGEGGELQRQDVAAGAMGLPDGWQPMGAVGIGHSATAPSPRPPRDVGDFILTLRGRSAWPPDLAQ